MGEHATTRKDCPAISTPTLQEAIMTRDDLIREYRNRSGSWPALVAVYGIIVACMFLSAAAIL
jgi:hypothetical protein